jgi:predicted Zn-dependent peptidase
MNNPTTITLACGMPLIVEPIAGVRSAGFCWLVPAGTSSEPEDRQGLGAVISEWLFRGAGELRSRQQADALDRLGLSRGSEVTGYYLRFTASMLGEKLHDALPLLTDIILRPRFDPEHLEPARDLALQALAGVQDNPQERAGLLLSNRYNPRPLHRAHYGTEAGLKALTREDALAHWAQRAKPQGSILAIAGDVDPQRVADRLNALLQGWSGSAPAPALTPAPSVGTCFHEQDDTSSQVQIFVAHRAPAEADADCQLERVVGAVLSGGSSCRLFTEVRERRGLCYSVSAAYSADRSFGRVTAYVGTTPEKAQESLDVLAAELARINAPAGAGGGISAEEFQRAIVRHKSGLVFSGESTSARAGALAGDYHRLGRARSLNELAGQIDQITLAKVNDYLARRDPGPLTIVTLGPRALNPPPGVVMAS